ncbi:flagellar M-ring protein FliF C-terminal domain-containing protein [Aporhodopirellula aestuarii]|uniref:Beta-cystathionase n=1 Tax=Aporhodopirellula aestuarii TaxID=2950107 RepID=A0ABT0U4M3_9BACT|nr:flagellar M-ring protein FliF C-terminal domain-containing protein [Aporhodopirellula aestuarii]MCM2371393.1 beta-cystathionase [Aporhodopirellula aestuarii]
MLKDILQQFRNVFLSMPVPSRVIAGLLITVIVIALGFLVRGSGSPQTEYLLGGKLLDEKDLDAAELAFGSAGLTGWKRDGRRMEIPIAQRSEFLRALEASAAMPSSLRSHIQAAIDSSTPFESSEQRLARVGHAKERDLSDNISKFPDVKTASVTYDLGERMGLSRGRKQSASVVVQPEGLDPLPRARIQMIKEMIRASFAGMQIDDVQVTDTNATSMPGDAENDDPMSKKRREEESYYENKIRSQLAGYGQIHVKTFADIDPTMGIEKASLKFDAQPTTLSETRRKFENESSRPMPGGVPGAQANALSNRPVKIEATTQTTKTKEDQTSSNRVAGQEYETTRTAALAVKRIRVSIGLPMSYYRQVHQHNFLQSNPDKKPEDIEAMSDDELQKLRDSTKLAIQSAVTPLLPEVSAGEDRFPLVEVWDYPDLPERAVASTGTGQAALTWLADSWQTIAMLLLAATALLVARGAMKSMGGDSDPAGFSEGFGLELPAPPVVVEEKEGKYEQMEITGGSLKDELVDLVEDNPEVAANVIRSWVGEAA